MHKQLLGRIWNPVYANDNDPYVPEIWAQESLMLLENEVIMPNMVHRDFENEIKNYGDTVNTRRPSAFTAVRKTDADDVTDQDATSTNVAVKLDQWFHTTFVIKDGEMSKSFKDLVAIYLVPAVQSIAQGLDEVCALQVYQFLGNAVGKLGTNPDRDTLILLKEKMSNNKCPLGGRQLVVNPTMEGALLAADDGFTDADKVGDNGQAMSEGLLGRKMGFTAYMDQNMPSIVHAPVAQGNINNSGGYPVGSTVMTVEGSPTLEVGEFITIAGDMTPQRITAVSGSPITQITVTPGLRYAVLNDAVIYAYSYGEVNLAGSHYDVNYAKGIITNNFVTAPVVGQLVNCEADPAVYYGLMSGSTSLLEYLDRPLETQWNDNHNIHPGPQGNYGFAFTRNAIALVTRPLATPPQGTARSAVANFNGLSIRVTMTYDGKAQGLRVTLDLLCGVKVLDTNLGAVLLG